MDKQLDELVELALKKLTTTPPTHRVLIAISGIPGSGKTSIADRIVKRLNHHHNHHTSHLATAVSMDGYHLTKSKLSTLPNPTQAHFRRGAAFTFDAYGLLNLIQTLSSPITPNKTIFAPSFDHAIKDPTPNGIAILPSHRIVILEGLYLSLCKPSPWDKIASLIPTHWFVHVDPDVAKKRLTTRHVQSGIVENEEEGRKRAENNDLVNGEWILARRIGLLTDNETAGGEGGVGKVGIEKVIESVEDYRWLNNE